MAVLTTARAVPRVGQSRLAPLALLALGLFALALGPRWLARDTYTTADEDNWMRRAGGFAWGVANGRLGRTYQNGHPGVLTMELAILGQGPGGAERFADPVTGNPRILSALPGFFDGLVDARRAFALATAVFVALFGLLAWRLLGPGPALVGGVLLALDPFFLAHSQLVHLDAVLTGCLGLALLCALIRWGRDGRLGWVLAGGAFSGLALLAKSPAVYLAAAVPLLALSLSRVRGWRALLADLTLWGLAGLLVFVAFWPSMWVDPDGTVARMLEFARETGGQPHEQGSYFLGQAVADPGPLFYLVALPLRLSPIVLVGLLALAAFHRRLGPDQRRLALAILLAALGFVAFMSLGAKKFDRYALPAFPLLDLAAGLGLWAAWRATRGRLHLIRSSTFAVLLLLLLAAWPAVSVFPHYLVYYNPLVGGGETAVWAIPVGEGEGLKEVGAWLNAQPAAVDLHVVASSYDALKATYVGGGEPLRDRVSDQADFVVLYRYQRQIGHSPRVMAEYGLREPEHVVRLNGVEYAWVYRGPRGGRG